jgi:inner membrane protease subunit 1
MSRLLKFAKSYSIPTVFGAVPISRFTIQFTKFVFGVHLFWEYFAQVKQTSGPSMLPTLNAYGDWVLVSNLYRRGKGIEVGDLVSVKHPMFPGTRAIKRVLGMPGDFVLRDTPGRSEMMLQVKFDSAMSKQMRVQGLRAVD